jgi:proteasome activator subunit 4
MRDFEQYVSMFALTNPTDAQYQRYKAYRERLGGLFHRISGLAIDKDVSNPDLIRWLCSAIGSYVNMYNNVEKTWSDNNKNHGTMVALGRQWYGQKELPRHYSIKRMEVYHLTRCHLVTMTRARDEIDDQLINDLVAFTISPYVKIRKTSQGYMKHVLASFRGVKALVLPQYLDKLRSDIDPDVVKGALYSLNQLLPFAIDRPEYLEELFIKLLDLEKQPKPSIQKLTAKILSEAIATTPSPVTLLQPSISSDDIRRFRFTDVTESDKKLPAEVSAKLVELRSKREKAYQSLIHNLLQRAPTVHWRYKTYIASVLQQLLVRELPVTAEHAKFFIDLVGDPHPALARCGLQAVTRILYIAKLRHLCTTEQELLLQRYTKHPLKREQSLTNISPDYTRQYIASLKAASIDDTDMWLEDDDITGWLCWNSTVTQRRLPGEGEVVFDFQGDAKVTIDAMRSSIEDAEFWVPVVRLWSQEKSRTQLSSSIIEFVRAVSQAYGPAMFAPLSKVMIDLIEGEKDEQRAFAEILTGMTRSAFVYWPKEDRDWLWPWLIETLDTIFKNMKQDSIDSWLDFWERTFDRRDIRRIRPLLDWIFDKAKNADYVNGSAFELEKISSFLSSMIGTGGWRYDAWSNELIEMTFREDIILNPYQEIRRYVADNFLNIENIRWHPSYPSAKAFLQDCRSNPEKDVIGSHSTMTEHVKRLIAKLPEWRKERVPGPSAPQSTYDKAASTILRFGYGLNELHASSVFDWAVPDLL